MGHFFLVVVVAAVAVVVIIIKSRSSRHARRQSRTSRRVADSIPTRRRRRRTRTETDRQRAGLAAHVRLSKDPLSGRRARCFGPIARAHTANVRVRTRTPLKPASTIYPSWIGFARTEDINNPTVFQL